MISSQTPPNRTLRTSSATMQRKKSSASILLDGSNSAPRRELAITRPGGKIYYATSAVSHATAVIDPYSSLLVAYLQLTQLLPLTQLWSLPLPRNSDQTCSPHSTSSPAPIISKTTTLCRPRRNGNRPLALRIPVNQKELRTPSGRMFRG